MGDPPRELRQDDSPVMVMRFTSETEFDKVWYFFEDDVFRCLATEIV